MYQKLLQVPCVGPFIPSLPSFPSVIPRTNNSDDGLTDFELGDPFEILDHFLCTKSIEVSPYLFRTHKYVTEDSQ